MPVLASEGRRVIASWQLARYDVLSDVYSALRGSLRLNLFSSLYRQRVHVRTVVTFRCLPLALRIRGNSKKYWDDDPLDGDHTHKRSVLKQSGIRIDAPFHPEYVPAHPISLKPPKKDVGRSSEITGRQADSKDGTGAV